MSVVKDIDTSCKRSAVTRTDKRLARLEAEIEALKLSLAERLDNLEAASEGRDNTPKSRIGKLFAWMGDEGPKLIVAVVLLVMGYWIKDSVDLAIKRQQLQLDSTKQMQSQLEIMADEKSTKE